MDIVKFIANFMTEDPCIFNEDAAAAPSNAEINQAAARATGDMGEAKNNVAADLKRQKEEEQRRKENMRKQLDPLLKQAEINVTRAEKNLGQAASNTDDNKEFIDNSTDDVNSFKNMLTAISKIATT